MASKENEINPLREKIIYEKPKEVKELQKELRERTRKVINEISGIATAKFEEVTKEQKEDNIWSESKIKKVTEDLEQRISNIKDIEKVLDPTIRERETRKIKEYQENILKISQEILLKLQSSNPKDPEISLYEQFNNERLNQLKWFELRKLNDVLGKVKNGELLDNYEASFLRYCAFFKFEDSEAKEKTEGEEKGEGQPRKTEPNLEPGPEPTPKPTPEPSPKPIPPEPSPEPTPKPSPEPTPPQPKPNPTPEPPPFPEPPPVIIEDIERRVLTVEQAENILNQALNEYLNRYRDYIRLQIEIRSERNEQIRLQREGELKTIELLLNNAKRIYDNALEEYKIARYFDIIKKKKEYIYNQIYSQKADIYRDRFRRENPNIDPKELEELVNKQIRQEAEDLFNKERREISGEILSIIAYDVLRRREALEQQRRNILREENERIAGFFGRLWNRYRNLSFARRATVGAVIAGVGAGAVAASGGGLFAALGIGTAYAVRRFFGGAVIGGGIKSLGDRIVGKRERKELDETTRQRVDKISQEIAAIINKPDSEPKNYEQWLEVAKHLDKRLEAVIAERKNIRDKNENSRRRWTWLAILGGGILANADNIYGLFTRHLESAAPIGGGGAIKEGVVEKGAGGGPSDIKIFQPPTSHPPENIIITEQPPEILPQIDLTSPDWFVSLDKELLRQSMIPAWIDRNGFWGAAKKLQELLGLSKEEFAKAWANSIVTDPISGEKLPIAKAFFVAARDAHQHLGLAFNPKTGLFEAVLGQKVKVGPAEMLIDVYKKAGKSIPFKVLWSMKQAGHDINQF